MKAADVKAVIGAFNGGSVVQERAYQILARECEHDESFASRHSRNYETFCIGCGKGLIRRQPVEAS